MTTSAIIAALDVAGILCLAGAVALAFVVVTELWRRAVVTNETCGQRRPKVTKTIEEAVTFPRRGMVVLRDGSRKPITIVAQGLDYVWVTTRKPTRLPGGRIRQPGETACVHRSHVRLTNA